MGVVPAMLNAPLLLPALICTSTKPTSASITMDTPLKEPLPSCLPTSPNAVPGAPDCVLLTQKSQVAVVLFKLAASGTSTKSSTPSKLNAWPTLPAANVAPFCSVPLLPSVESLALPSALNQLVGSVGMF